MGEARIRILKNSTQNILELPTKITGIPGWVSGGVCTNQARQGRNSGGGVHCGGRLLFCYCGLAKKE